MSKEVEFNIKVTMNERWVNDFCSMLKWMQSCGNLGHSSIVGETNHISGLTLSANFDQEFYNSIPELTITRSHLPDKEKIDRLIDIRERKGDKKKKGEKND